MKLDDDDFVLLGLPRRQAQDRNLIDSRWRELQAKVHPDRFAAEGAAAQRVAMQWAVRVNEAYQRMKDPVRRGAYLCELNGAAIQAENNTAMPAGFLVQQMTWRESLEEAGALADVEMLSDEVAAHRTQALEDLRVSIDERGDFVAAAQQVRALMFVERFADDIEHRLEALGQ